ncbi:acyl-CoA dehydrogenase [Starkeya sp. ORNL1]|uniref:acyl-CoA dehydrogenase family protein n=1 Tax=Starkeya sp. ORNL1 TaxID=2709380 RepID=UPI0014628D3D|nr:acyl-CoA dehydrogenase family protein [Starkeya sp. ORNL1]QJP17132.1 acyl-CoA dehydrogenase [Starkeya sp. ORNL1]
MTVATQTEFSSATPLEILAIAKELGPKFAERARSAGDDDVFVSENYKDLRASGLVEAGVPADFGGRGADVGQLCAMIRELAQHCGSTALAFAMHTHQVAIPAWRWTHQQAAPVVPLLKRVAAERIILLSSGGSDWIEGSGKAERVEGGYKITARKVFTSGSPSGDLLMTGAVLEGEPEGPLVLHFGVPMKSQHVSVPLTWKALGMRGTGSNDVVIDGHFVPEEGVALRRKQGEWHMLFHIISMVAFPIIYAAYLGVAESARDIALGMAKRRAADPHVVTLVGQMETELRAAQYAHAGMIATAERGTPSPETTNEIMIGRSLVARHAIAAVELAMEAAGGAAFFRDNGLERRFRDIQGARYHPMRSGAQQEFAGRLALGLDTARTF